MATSDFPVVCVWVDAPLVNEPGAAPSSCLKLLNRFGFRTRFLALHKTLKTKKVEAGRNDVFFGIYKDDIAKFAVARFRLFSLETGFLYGIIYKDDNLAKQTKFFHENGSPTFSITDEFEQFAVFKVKLFDINQNFDEATAEKSVNEFIAVAQKYETAFPNCKSLKMFDGGFIRWWEDIVDNDSADCYPPRVLDDFPVN